MNGASVELKRDSVPHELLCAAVREVTPVLDFIREEKRQPADGEVGVAVGDKHSDVRALVEFTGAEGGSDPGVAAAHDDQVHRDAPTGRRRLLRRDGREAGRGLCGARS